MTHYIIQGELATDVLKTGHSELRAMLGGLQSPNLVGVYFGVTRPILTVVVDVPREEALSPTLQAVSAVTREPPEVWVVLDFLALPAEHRTGPVPGVELHRIVSPREPPWPTAPMVTLEVGASTEEHAHDWPHLMVVLSGHGTVHIHKGNQPLASGQVLSVAPGVPHYFYNDGDEVLRFADLSHLREEVGQIGTDLRREESIGRGRAKKTARVHSPSGGTDP